MWGSREFRILRWFMALAGVGLLIPGAIFLMSWPDTMLAFGRAFGSGLAPIAGGFSVAALVLGGLSFICGRGVRIGAVLAGVALLLGAFVHWQWSQMMNQRLEMLPASLSDEQRTMLEDTIRFAGNAQIPHMLKNLVLAGICVVVFVLGPGVCRACKEVLGKKRAGEKGDV